tara:strand:- start:2616 stop:2822 length:207 start_codon:yes stop_codon:yes gene_type:complete
MIPVEGHKNLFRDPETGAILETDNASYSRYIRSKNKKIHDREELDEMRKDIDEIKILLKQLVNNKPIL